jgi:hypothetical protein
LRADVLAHPEWPAAQNADFILGPVFVGLYCMHRRPRKRFGLLLVVLGLLGVPSILRSLTEPTVFGIGVVAEDPIYVMTTIVILAFPTGHLAGRPERLVIGRDAQQAAGELRTLAHGIYPRTVETGISFCATEAVQNAIEHAGDGARVTITLGRDAQEVHFAIADDDVGMVAPPSWDGEGLIGMRDRVGVVAGELEIVSSLGAGTTVRGSAPLSASAREEAA